MALAGLLIPFALFAALLLAYSVFWHITANTLSARFAAWAEAERTAGAEVSWTQNPIEGFPYRLEMRIEAPAYVDLARTGWGWRADRLTLTAMPYNTAHVIANFNGMHRLVSPTGAVYEGNIEGGAASASFSRGALRRADFVIERALLNGETGRGFTLEAFQIHASPMPDAPSDMRLWIEARQIIVPESWPAPLDAFLAAGAPVSDLKAAIALTSGLAKPVTESPTPIAAWQQAEGRIVVAMVEARAGLIVPGMKGELKLGKDRRLNGLVELRLNEVEALWQSLSETERAERPIGVLAGLARALGPTDFMPVLIEGGRVVSPLLPDRDNPVEPAP
jgi:hypothetical protein